MSDPPGGMGSSLGVVVFSLQLGLGRIVYKFDYPGGRDGSCCFFSNLTLYRNTLRIVISLSVLSLVRII